MNIVPFKPTDIDAVFEIQRAAYEPLYETYRDDLSNPYMESKETVLEKYTRANTVGYLFVKDGVTVGCVRIILNSLDNSGRVSALAVHPQYQGQGIAQTALLEIERIHDCVQKWHLDTILQETGNCHLYEKLGYRKIGLEKPINGLMTLVSYEKLK